MRVDHCGWSDFVFSSRRRHTRCALVTGVQTCALPILTGLRLDDAGIAAVFAADFDVIVGRTRRLFQAVGGGLDSYPDAVQLAVIDMAFNLGPDGDRKSVV